jgi:hypothetical protein
MESDHADVKVLSALTVVANEQKVLEAFRRNSKK